MGNDFRFLDAQFYTSMDLYTVSISTATAVSKKHWLKRPSSFQKHPTLARALPKTPKTPPDVWKKNAYYPFAPSAASYTALPLYRGLINSCALKQVCSSTAVLRNGQKPYKFIWFSIAVLKAPIF